MLNCVKMKSVSKLVSTTIYVTISLDNLRIINKFQPLANTLLHNYRAAIAACLNLVYFFLLCHFYCDE